MPMRSGRRRGASEERRGRRPHSSPTRPERNDRQPVRLLPFLLCLSFLSFPCCRYKFVCVHASRVVTNKELSRCIASYVCVCCQCMSHQCDCHRPLQCQCCTIVCFTAHHFEIFDVSCLTLMFLRVCMRAWLCSKNRRGPIRDSKASPLNLKSCVVLAKRCC